MGVIGEVRTAKQLGIPDAPPHALYMYTEFVTQDGIDDRTGAARWVMKRKWLPIDSAEENF